jgi:hypothetical protein
MSARADFNEEEWNLLRAAPAMAGLAVIAASPSGPVGVFKELYSVGKFVIATARQAPANALLAELATELAGQTDTQAESLDLAGRNIAQIKADALEACRQVADLLDGKAPADAPELKRWLLSVAAHVAEAAREGGFLGFGGVQVNDAERAALDEVRLALRI